MTYIQPNPNGQATMANSTPVVVSSDQSAIPISVASLPLPATAATSAKQDTGNTSVASIDTKTPTLGQALAASSVPVVLTAAQVTTLTPPAAITGYALDATLTGGTQKSIARGGAKGATAAADITSTSVDANTQALHTSVTNFPASQAVTGTFFQATQPVSLATNTPTLQAGSTTTVTQATGTNLHVVVDTAPTTAITNANLDVALSTRLKPADTLAGVTTVATVTTVGAVTAITNALPVGANVIGKVSIDQTTPGTTNAVTDTKLPASAASSDALANPTITQIGADNMVFNGTTWDRQRGMSVATATGDTGAKTATGNGATQTNVGNKGVFISIILGTVSGTTPTCIFKVQGSADAGTTWHDIPGAVTASLVATGNFGVSIYPGQVVTAGATTTNTQATANGVLPRTWRMVWTIGGTTPSFAITSITYNYLPN